ncbi:hypothetical protein [Thalassobellus suaedae]|uniref:Uncharacterized protein n=1 Tax=Thalassobellus suaedae TaxID=3074124 RepID=A0ABY9XQF2_9FLAO|nr:hypothetical protein RHP51_12645 [Flavobacteriaceae bacterium HL-DH14]
MCRKWIPSDKPSDGIAKASSKLKPGVIVRGVPASVPGSVSKKYSALFIATGVRGVKVCTKKLYFKYNDHLLSSSFVLKYSVWIPSLNDPVLIEIDSFKLNPEFMEIGVPLFVPGSVSKKYSAATISEGAVVVEKSCTRNVCL